MTKRMLIDAAHPEEVRVAVMDGNILEELDIEASARKQLKGNIYLAKVTRVEPSLQAAFIDYGGNKHGFLAFSEIHPDYYQIPIVDREKLLEEEHEETHEEAISENKQSHAEEYTNENKTLETIGGDDIDEVQQRPRFFPAKRYKIQEVIKRRQILLIQVNKEERGNKGAALTTYLSLAGRYCVLMPNSGKGGGISRKISNNNDRKRLKSIISELDIPQGIAVIVRTAGSDRSKAEIKRDYEYLIKLWTSIRDLTLKSTAPCLIHEEGSIIKRAIRDHYSKDIEEVVVSGDGGYRQAKDLMKMLVPSHAKKVQPYKDNLVTLFNQYNIESQLSTINVPQVQLKSGGYIVIDVTEALIAIDVNSGRATRGRSVEETAFKTNLEAASEVARQLRLRDLAGLVVIDFIDMEVNRNQTTVERRLKDAMRKDRARIQIGRISPFGLLELSRQRLRTSITETITEICPHCDGSGHRRSIESTALHVLRGIDEHCSHNTSDEVGVLVHSQVALYILNHKRDAVATIETKFKVKLILLEDDKLIPPEFVINKTPNNKPQKNNFQEKQTDNSDGHPRNSQKRKKRSRSRKSDYENSKIEEASDTTNLKNKDEIEVKENTIKNNKTDHQNSDAKEKNTRRRRGRRGGRNKGRNTVEPDLIDNQKILSPNVDSAEQIQNSIKVIENINVQDLKQELNQQLNSPKIENDNSSLATEDLFNEAVVSNQNRKGNNKLKSEKNTDSSSNSSYSPNITMVGEDKPKDKKNTRGGWWKKITNG
ncbi:MAG: ribonuclease E/G [Rhodospirillales bacterium]